MIERKPNLEVIKKTITKENIRELFDYRMISQMLNTFTLIELDLEDETVLDKLKVFLTNRFKNNKLFYVVNDGAIIFYKINHKYFKVNNEYAEAQLKRVKEIVKSFPNIETYTDEIDNSVSFNTFKGTHNILLKEVIKEYCLIHNKRSNTKKRELIVNLIENIYDFGKPLNLLEKNTDIEAIINFIENKYSIKDRNDKEIYWKNLPLKYKFNILKIKCRM